MSKLYSFEVKKEVKTPVEKVVKNQDGTETKVTETVTTEETHKFSVRKPTRPLRDAADLYRGKKYGEALRNGMMPAALVGKRLVEDQGILSETEKEEKEKLQAKSYTLQAELVKANSVPEKDRTEDQKKEIARILDEINAIRNSLSRFEEAQLSVYNNSVEVYVRNKTIFFYTLFMSYKDEAGKEVPFFGDIDSKDFDKRFEAKLNKYDELEELFDPFIYKVINKFLLITTIWFITGEENEEALKNLVEPVKETGEKVTPP